MPCAVYRIRVIVPHALFCTVAILQRFQRGAVRVGVAGDPDKRSADLYIYAGERDNRGHGTREILRGFGGVACVCGAVGACPDIAQPLKSLFVLRREILEKRCSIAVGVCVRVELLAECPVRFFEIVESSAGVKVASHDITPFVCAVLAALCFCDGLIIPPLWTQHNIGKIHKLKSQKLCNVLWTQRRSVCYYEERR